MVQDRASESPEETHRALDKKREILRAASVVFRRQGFHDAGMRDIAAEAGMHAGNLYYYFANKQELLAFCQEDSLGQLLEMAARVRAGSMALDEQLRRLIVEHVQILNEAIPGSLAHLEVEALDEPWRLRVQQRRDEYESIVRLVIQQGSASGVFKAVDAKVASLAILGAVNWTVKWFQPNGARTAGSIGEDFADLLVSGLR